MTDYSIIKKCLSDELNDVLSYLEMMDKATEHSEKQILKDIAKDEYSHARFLKHILDKNSTIQMTETEKELWKKVEDKAKDI